MKRKEDIISYEVMGGWPIYKMSIREIIEKLGFELKDNKWQIDDNNPILDVYPKKLQDDGMGYGVNEEQIIEVSTGEYKNELFCNIFTEPKLKNVEMWNISKFYYGAVVLKKDDKTKYFITEIDKNENNSLKYLCIYINENNEKISEWFNEEDLEIF